MTCTRCRQQLRIPRSRVELARLRWQYQLVQCPCQHRLRECPVFWADTPGRRRWQAAYIQTMQFSECAITVTLTGILRTRSDTPVTRVGIGTRQHTYYSEDMNTHMSPGDQLTATFTLTFGIP